MATDVRVISIGALEANPLWDERGDVRPGHATTTLLRTDDATILVDPSLPAAVLEPRLRERAGIGPEAITHVFLTTFRPLQRRGLALFEGAKWLVGERERETVGVGLIESFRKAEEAGDEELAALLKSEIELLRRVQSAPDSIVEGIDLFPLPGVTGGLCGLLVADPTLTTLITGDAIATVDHLAAGRVLSPCEDIEAAQESFREAIEIADVLVLGRDNLTLSPGRVR